MKRAVIYCRVSTTDQAEDGNSLETQEKDCRAYAERNNMIVEAVFFEDYTGMVLERPKLIEMRQRIQAGEFDVILCYTSSRLSRKEAHTLYLADGFWKQGLEIHFVETGKIQNTPEGFMQLGIGALLAGYQRTKFLEVTKRNMRTKAESGRIPGAGPPPFGYRYNGTRKDKHLVIYEPEARIISLVFQWYVYGDERGLLLNVTDIAQKLTLMSAPVSEHGLRRREAPGYHSSTVWRWLKNETYAGTFYAYKLKQVAKNKSIKADPSQRVAIPVPAIVDRELWEAAQRRMAQLKTHNKRNTQARFLLRGRIRCACGYACNTWRGYHKGRKGTAQYLMQKYVCLGQNKKRNYKLCPQPANWPTKVIDKMVWEWIRNLLLSPDALRESLKRIQSQKTIRLQRLEEERDSYVTNLERIKKQLDKLFRLYLSADDDDDYALAIYNEKKDRLDKLRKELQESIAQIDDQIHKLNADETELEALIEFSRQIQEGPDSCDFEHRRHLVELLNVRALVIVEDGARFVEVSSRVDTSRLNLDDSLRATGR